MLEERKRQVIAEFQQLPSEMLRYSFLVELAGQVPPGDSDLMREEYLIPRCQSQVWVKLRVQDEGKFHMEATSDTLIIRGLLHVAMTLLNGCPLQEVASNPIDLAQICKLTNHFGGSRNAGLQELQQTIHSFARTHPLSGDSP